MYMTVLIDGALGLMGCGPLNLEKHGCFKNKGVHVCIWVHA